MRGQTWDVIFIGGGFAAGLAAYKLLLDKPELRCLLLEARSAFADDQTWSFQSLPYAVDPTPSKAFSAPRETWIAPLLGGAWDRYEVRFPKLRRVIEHPYFSIRAAHFYDFLRQQLPGAWRLGEHVVRWDHEEVETADRQIYRAPCVIDSRGWTASHTQRPCGYQKFLGLQIRTREPHGLSYPTIMDACLPQNDGFRFMYALPWSQDELLLEDTHYSDTSEVDSVAYEQEIRSYAEAHGWTIEKVLGREVGALPIPFRGEPLPSNGADLGVGGGLFHATTGYSIYEAVLAAERLAALPKLTTAQVQAELQLLRRQRWDQQDFYRRLNNMLFRAAEPARRYQILECFYAHPHDLLARFYAGYSSWQDKLRILSRKPPVPLGKGLYYFFHTFGAHHGSR